MGGGKTQRSGVPPHSKKAELRTLERDRGTRTRFRVRRPDCGLAWVYVSARQYLTPYKICVKMATRGHFLKKHGSTSNGKKKSRAGRGSRGNAFSGRSRRRRAARSRFRDAQATCSPRPPEHGPARRRMARRAAFENRGQLQVKAS